MHFQNIPVYKKGRFRGKTRKYFGRFYNLTRQDICKLNKAASNLKQDK